MFAQHGVLAHDWDWVEQEASEIVGTHSCVVRLQVCPSGQVELLEHEESVSHVPFWQESPVQQGCALLQVAASAAQFWQDPMLLSHVSPEQHWEVLVQAELVCLH